MTLINEGFSQEMLNFYDYEIPFSEEDTYMSWSVKESVLDYYTLIEDMYLNRYQSYSFYELLHSNAEVKTLNSIFKNENGKITPETLDSLFKKELKTIEELSEEEQIAVKIIMKMIYGIKYDNFQYDW